jgi:hypothetical protein
LAKENVFSCSIVMLQSRNETYLPPTSCAGNYSAIDGRTKGSKAPCGCEEGTRSRSGTDKLHRQGCRWFSKELFHPDARGGATSRYAEQHRKNIPASRCPGRAFVGTRVLRLLRHNSELGRLRNHAGALLSRAPDWKGWGLDSASLRGRAGGRADRSAYRDDSADERDQTNEARQKIKGEKSSITACDTRFGNHRRSFLQRVSMTRARTGLSPKKL